MLRTLSALALTCSLLATACEVAPVDEELVVDEPAPIATLALANGNVIDFFELTPGEIIVSETGFPPNPPTPVEGLTPVDIFRAYAPGEEIPAALEQAQARAGVEPYGTEVAPAELPAPDVAYAAGPCDKSWFESSFCSGGGGFDFNMCLTNWWNGAYAYAHNAFYHYTVVCPFKGNVVLSIHNQGAWTVSQGTYRWASKWASYSWFDWDEFFFRADVKYASGDGFHFHTRVAQD